MSEPVHTTETPAMDASGVIDPAAAEAMVADQPPADTDQLGDAGKRAIDRMKAERDEARRLASANADAARRLKEIEDRDLSELQKAQRDREEALSRLQEVEREALRNRVALTKGLPAEIAASLNGSSEEELAAHADRLLAWRGNVPPTTPRPDQAQGARPSTPQGDEDAEYARFFPQG